MLAEPAITVSGDSSGVVFNNCGFPLIESGVCVIQVRCCVYACRTNESVRENKPVSGVGEGSQQTDE